tara:strand:- start:30490 stop:31518 length:1029 start_codon:yes stop_codon:yes gene_type:complete
VNYGSQASLLAKGLRNININAKTYTIGDQYQRDTDFEFKKRNSLPSKLVYYYFIYPVVKLYVFIYFQTFHFYFGRTLTQKKWDLPLYRFFGKKVIMHYLGDDIRNYKLLISRYKLPKDHLYVKNEKSHDGIVSKRIKREIKYVDLFIASLPTHVDFAKEYGLNVKNIIPLSLNLESLTFQKQPKIIEEIRIIHGTTNRKWKGTSFIQESMESLIKKGYPINFKIVEDITHAKLIEEIENCHIYIDQISFGWYGAAALESMAIGRPTLAFIDESYFRYIDYDKKIPIININKQNFKDVLEDLINKPEDLDFISLQSRKFVEEHHDINVTSRNLLKLYQNQLWK